MFFVISPIIFREFEEVSHFEVKLDINGGSEEEIWSQRLETFGFIRKYSLSQIRLDTVSNQRILLDKKLVKRARNSPL